MPAIPHSEMTARFNGHRTGHAEATPTVVRLDASDRVPAPTVSVIIPALNEGESVGDVVARCREVLGDYDEVIVVNDGSNDDTPQKAQDAGARVINRPYRGGNGSAIKAGARVANGRYVVMLDADGQHDPALIPDLVRGLETHDMVVAARSSDSHASLGRRVANGVFNGFASRLSGREIEDLTSGFRAVKRSVLLEFLSLLPNHFSYPTTITLASLKAGYTVDFVPMQAARRVGTEKSKIRPTRDGINFLQIIFKIVTLYAPMRVFAPLAALPAVLGMLSFTARLITGRGASVTGALLMTMAMFLFCMGLISEQIAALRFERHGDHAQN